MEEELKAKPLGRGWSKDRQDLLANRRSLIDESLIDGIRARGKASWHVTCERLQDIYNFRFWGRLLPNNEIN